MRNKNYRLFKVHSKTAEILDRVKEVLQSGFINEGTQVLQLTNAFAVRFKTDQLVLTNSCTSALTMALRLANVKPYDDVISTPMTCVATNMPIVNNYADIIWADIDPNTGCISASSVEDILDKNPKVKAVMAVAWAGIPPNLAKLSRVCSKKNVKLILDAAHAMFATYKGKPIHDWADYTCYSLQAIKHVTTGDGGILVCKDKNDYQRSKSLKWFGIDRDKAKDQKGNWKGQHWDLDILEPGFKFNMNNLSAAVGLAQMPYIDGIIEAHRTNAKLYSKLLKKSKFVKPLTVNTKTMNPSYWVYTVKIKHKKLDRNSILQKLNDQGIMAGLVHTPNQSYTCFESAVNRENLTGVEKFASNQFSLPVGWWLVESDVRQIVDTLNEICKKEIESYGK